MPAGQTAGSRGAEAGRAAMKMLPDIVLAQHHLEAGERERVAHRRAGRKERVGVARQAGVGARHEVREHDAEQATRREPGAHAADEVHRIGDEVDRVRDVNEIVAARRLDLLELADAGADAGVAVEAGGRRVGVDALGIPAVVGEDAHGLSEPARDIEKAARPICAQSGANSRKERVAPARLMARR